MEHVISATEKVLLPIFGEQRHFVSNVMEVVGDALDALTVTALAMHDSS